MGAFKRVVSEIHRRSLWQILAVYLVSAWAVFQVALGLVEAVVLPDWVAPSAFILLLLGLPLVLATAFVHDDQLPPGARSLAELADFDLLLDPPPPPPGEGVEGGLLTRHLSWRRTTLSMGAGFGVLVLVSGGYLATRTLGVGPAGSLIAKDLLAPRDTLLLADAENLTDDPYLGETLTEALRVDLLRTGVVTLLSQARVSEAMKRSGRDPGAPLEHGLALELAVREGAGAVIAGTVGPAGAGYLLTVQVVEGGSGRQLVAFRESASDPAQILDAINRLSRKLRGGLGESLASLVATEPLAAVTTSSLEALTLYSRARRVHAMQGDYVRAAELQEEAVALDTAFAAAYRGLAISLSNAGLRRARQLEAIEKAWSHRNRLPALERLLIEAAYHDQVSGDRAAAVQAYRGAIEVDPGGTVAYNNLSILYGRMGHYAEQETLLRQAISLEPQRLYFDNLIAVLFRLGKRDEARAVFGEAASRFGESVALARSRVLMAAAEERWADAHALAVEMDSVYGGSAWGRSRALLFQIQFDVLLGRLGEAHRHRADLESLSRRLGLAPQELVSAGLAAAWRILVEEDREGGAALLDSILTRPLLGEMDARDRPYPLLAAWYVQAGYPDRAEALLERWEAEVPPAERGTGGTIHATRGVLAAARGDLDTALREMELYREASACRVCALADEGWIHEWAGKAEDAVETRESYLATPEIDRYTTDHVELAHVLEYLARHHDQNGDAARAAMYYRRLVELWKDADPPLQPRVQAARRRAEVLERSSGGS